MISEAIAVAIITGAITLIGNILAILSSSKKTEANLEKAQAVTDTKLDELTREVRNHNEFASRIPVIEEQIKAVNHRIDDLERKAG